MKSLDNRGLACPQPVIATKKALDSIEQGTIISIVDNEPAKRNVIKLANNLGCTVAVEQKGPDFYLTITKQGYAQPTGQSVDPQCDVLSTNESVVFCTSDTLGQGSVELGDGLIKTFFYALTEHATPPKAVVFMNGGVKLSVMDSPVLDSLQELQDKGTEIVSCGTCLDYFGLKDKLAIGEISNMYTITELLVNAGHVIKV